MQTEKNTEINKQLLFREVFLDKKKSAHHIRKGYAFVRICPVHCIAVCTLVILIFPSSQELH